MSTTTIKYGLREKSTNELMGIVDCGFYHKLISKSDINGDIGITFPYLVDDRADAENVLLNVGMIQSSKNVPMLDGYYPENFEIVEVSV